MPSLRSDETESLTSAGKSGLLGRMLEVQQRSWEDEI
jgi:hypothetical protein